MPGPKLIRADRRVNFGGDRSPAYIGRCEVGPQLLPAKKRALRAQAIL